MIYKLKPEIPCFGPLAPRYFMSKHSFSGIYKKKVLKLEEKKCEACGKTNGLIDLHESFSIRQRRYIFEGFYFLCRYCHMNLVHYIQCYHLDLNEAKLSNFWNKETVFRSKSIFKKKDSFIQYSFECLNNVIDFIFSDAISADYGKTQEVGLDSNEVYEKFYKTYDHFDSRLRFLLNVAPQLFSTQAKNLTSFQAKVYPYGNKHIDFIKKALASSHATREELIKTECLKIHLELQKQKTITDLINAGFTQEQISKIYK